MTRDPDLQARLDALAPDRARAAPGMSGTTPPGITHALRAKARDLVLAVWRLPP